MVFLAALGTVWYRGIDVSCGCFSTSDQAASDLLMDMLRDGILLLMAIALWIRLKYQVQGSQ
jgi:hypothetical protein